MSLEREESERFWNDRERTIDKVGNGYRLCMKRIDWR